MNKKEEEIQRKLMELETSVLKEQTDLTTTAGHSTSSNMNTTSGGNTGRTPTVNASNSPDGIPRSDGAFLGGLALVFLGLVMVFQHVKVSSGLLAMLGMGSGGFALLFLPLMIGIGMMFYNPKSKWGWVMTALSCVFLILSFLATLVVTFPALTMLQMIMMFLPFAIGGALLVKGLGGAKGVEQAVKSQMIKKQG
jgi:uncharacterized protein